MTYLDPKTGARVEILALLIAGLVVWAMSGSLAIGALCGLTAAGTLGLLAWLTGAW